MKLREKSMEYHPENDVRILSYLHLCGYDDHKPTMS